MTKSLAIVPLALALVLGAACGSSSSELQSARATTYKGPASTLFAAAKAGLTANHFDIRESDEGNLRLETQPIWYTPDGTADTTTGENIARLQEDSIHLTYQFQFTKADGDTWRLSVVPLIGRKHGLTSVPENVDKDDPSLPGWVAGRTRSVELDLRDRLKDFAVPATNGTMPAAAPAPAAPAPAAPAAAPEPAAAPAPAAP
ncbi:MAG: hypothetical protein ABJE66_16200 [Deltaproteobacteria bacterium]